MKNVLLGIVTGVVIVAVILAAVEGVHALVRGPRPGVSLTYEALLSLGMVEPPRHKVRWAYRPYFADPAELSDLLGPLIEAGIGVGNTPFRELLTDYAAINVAADSDGCLGIKPALHSVTFHLRSASFNPYDPISVFYAADTKLDERLATFFQRYGTPPVAMSTNANGERLTLPVLERPRKVLIAGDSVAFGAMIGDESTLASQLQARDPQRQYVNLGVAGARAADVVCRLGAAMKRYSGQVDELIYVYCENDFNDNAPYGKPEEVIEWLVQMAAREKIGKVTVVFAPFIYTITPEITRLEGYEGATHPHRERPREDLVKAVEATGFRWIDMGTLAREADERRGSEFAFFALFVDHVHWSAEGTALVADRIMAQ
jgi:hypothetical protein